MQGIALGGKTTGGSSVGATNPLPVYTPFGFGCQMTDGTYSVDVVSSGTAGAWGEGILLLGRDTAGTFYPVPLTAGGGTVVTPVGGSGGGTEVKLLAGTNQVGTFTQANNLPIVAGTNTIGTVVAISSTSGTLMQLMTGTNIIGTATVQGTVGIGSQIRLMAGTNTVGTFTQANNPAISGTVALSGQAQLATGTNMVGTFTIGTALPAGYNTIGTVIAIGSSSGTLMQLLTGTNVIGTATVQGTVGVSSQIRLASGTNLAGTLSVNPLPTSTNSIGTVTQANNPPIASGTNTIGTVITSISSGTITTITNDVSIDDGGNTITVDGSVNATILPAGTVGNGQNTVASAGTAEALAGSTAIESVTIKALHANTGMIYVGDSGVDSTNGFVLDAGETVSMDVDNLADIYIDADTSTDGVSFLYIT